MAEKFRNHNKYGTKILVTYVGER